MKIEIFDKEELLTTVDISIRQTVGERRYWNTEITRWNIENRMQPFAEDEITTAMVNAYLERRIFNENRPDKQELLEALGLDQYQPIEIAKKTHGIMAGDNVWMRFDDETFTWEDVMQCKTSK